MRHITLIYILLSFFFQISAQSTFPGETKEEKYIEGRYFFDHELYGTSAYKYRKYSGDSKMSWEGHYPKLDNDALFQAEIADLYLSLPQAPNRLNFSIDKHLPDPVTLPAILELGSYYYNKREYKNCVETYDKTDLDMMPFADQVVPRFNKGYCYFVMKEFESAKQEFLLIKKDLGAYYFHVHYYLGLCEYFTGNLDKAVANFKVAEQTALYKPYIPYYISQIYFKQGKIDEMILYGEQSIKTPSVKNKSQIRLLLGQAYFAKADYSSALPHFDDFAGQTQEMTVEEFYQIGFTYYKNDQCQKALKYFDAIHREKNNFGQLANYYLADCYLKNKDNNGARIAFKNVSQMDYIPEMRDEAAFNYAKLTAESGVEREAINALENIKESSKFYNESRDILADVLNKSSDIYHSISILENQKKMTSRLKSIYQNKQIQAGHKAYLDKNWSSAEVHYTKSLQYTESKELEAEAWFWKAQIKQNTNDFDGSIITFDKYFNYARNLVLPVENSPLMAYYAQGFNYLKKLNYKKAMENYQKVGQIYFMNALSSQPWKGVAGDAAIRVGDCAFKERDYQNAKKYYQDVIDKKWDGADYAQFQKGIILGLQNEPYEKILALKELTSKFKNSLYQDQALMHIGDTYSNLNSLDNAYSTYQELIKKHGNTSYLANEARIKSGLIAYNRGDMNTAIKLYNDVLQNNPRPQEIQSALTGLEEIYINDLGKPDEYLALLEKLPGFKPSEYSVDSLNFKVGEVRFLNGDYEKAIESFSVYLQKFPKGYYHIQAHYYKAESYAVLKRYSEALIDYVKIIRIGNNPFYESSLKKAAMITFNHTGDYEQAFEYYDLYYKVAKVESEKLWAASGAMKSAFKNSNMQGVILYGDLVHSSTYAKEEEKANASYYMGKISYSQKLYEQSLFYFQKIGNDINNNQAAEARFWIGDLLIKQEKWDEAEAHSNVSNELNKYYPYWIARTVLMLADIYVHKQDLYSARAAVEAVLENFSDDPGLMKLANEKKEIIELKEKENSKIKPKVNHPLFMDEGVKN